MLNRKQYLLLCFIEELGEVQKEAIKCLRFGPHHSPMEGHDTNFERLAGEWSELVGIMELMAKEGLEVEEIDSLINYKIKRTEDYYNISKALGQAE